MINEIKQDAQERMKKSVEALEHAFAKIRTGRAHPALLDSIMVSYYGSDTPLRQVANKGGEAIADFVRFRREARDFLHDDFVEVARQQPVVRIAHDDDARRGAQQLARRPDARHPAFPVRRGRQQALPRDRQ